METLKDPHILYYAIPVFLAMVIAEAWYSHRHHMKNVEMKDSLASLACGVGSIIASLGAKVVLLPLYVLLYEITPLRLGTEWWAWIIAFVAFDFAFYWAHRFGHESRIGWAGHVAHHNSEKYNLATALRQPWTHAHLGLFYMPIALLGVSPIMFLIVNSISTAYQFWIHTELIGKLGPLEWVLNTPSHHRVHHGSNPQYIDKNYGAVLIIWDRLFGTFEEEQEQVVYGITKNIKSNNLLTINLHEWKAMFADAWRTPGVVNKLKTIFYRPGWAPVAEAVPAAAPKAEEKEMTLA